MTQRLIRNTSKIIPVVLQQVPIESFQPVSVVTNSIALADEDPADIQKVLSVMTKMGHIETDPNTGNIRLSMSGAALIDALA